MNRFTKRFFPHLKRKRNKTDIPQSFTEALNNNDLTDLTKEGLEITFDAIINNDILKSIPVIGIIVATIRTSKNIINLFFLKKLVSFLKGVSDIQPEKREAMIKKIDKSNKYRQKIGDFLLFQINHCDDDLKAFYLSIAFRAVINEELSYEDFMRISNIINRLPTIDFEDFIKRNEFHEEDTLLIGCGLLSIHNPANVIEDSEYINIDIGNGLDVRTTVIGETIKHIYESIDDNLKRLYSFDET